MNHDCVLLFALSAVILWFLVTIFRSIKFKWNSSVLTLDMPLILILVNIDGNVVLILLILLCRHFSLIIQYSVINRLSEYWANDDCVLSIAFSAANPRYFLLIFPIFVCRHWAPIIQYPSLIGCMNIDPNFMLLTTTISELLLRRLPTFHLVNGSLRSQHKLLILNAYYVINTLNYWTSIIQYSVTNRLHKYWTKLYAANRNNFWIILIQLSWLFILYAYYAVLCH